MSKTWTKQYHQKLSNEWPNENVPKMCQKICTNMAKRNLSKKCSNKNPNDCQHKQYVNEVCKEQYVQKMAKRNGQQHVQIMAGHGWPT